MKSAVKGRVKEYMNILSCKCIKVSRRIHREMITLVQERSEVLREKRRGKFENI